MKGFPGGSCGRHKFSLEVGVTLAMVLKSIKGTD